MFDFLKTKKKDDQKQTNQSSPVEGVTAAANVVSNIVGAVASPASGKYTVKAGDSLSKIAKKHNISLKQIIAANPQIKNPDLIHPNDVVNLG